jgi:hypothetical protein
MAVIFLILPISRQPSMSLSSMVQWALVKPLASNMSLENRERFNISHTCETTARDPILALLSEHCSP